MSWKIYHKVACPNCQQSLEVAPQVSRISYEQGDSPEIKTLDGQIVQKPEQVLVVAWRTSFIYHECGQDQDVEKQWTETPLGITPDDLRLEQ